MAAGGSGSAAWPARLPTSKQMPATIRYRNQHVQPRDAFWEAVERGCLSRSTFDNSKLVKFRIIIRQFGLLRVGHPRSVPFRQYALRIHYFFTVNGTENWVFSHISLMMPPPAGFGSIAIVNWSTVLSSVSFFRSILASSFTASSASL